MTSSPSALHLLLDREQAERDRLLGELQQCSRRSQDAREQSAQLLVYRDEYRQRWTGQFARSGSVEILRCYQGFSERLDQAIAHQQRAEQQCEQLEAQSREALGAQELRLASVRKLIERRQADARREGQRREQRESDETAQRVATRPAWHGDGLLPAAS